MPSTLTAGDAHVAADARAIVPSIDNEIMTLGFPSEQFVERHLTIGIEALKLIRRHGKSVKHLRFDE